jgi:hypothetical protein
MWGFVSDYARLDIIYKHGGVYFDTDVELIKNIDDLLCDDAFWGYEGRQTKFVNNGAGFGAIAGLPMVKEQLKVYDRISFINNDGSLNLTSCPTYQTELFLEAGFKQDDTVQIIQGVKIYPSDVLSPKDSTYGLCFKTENTYAIHHFTATWFNETQHEQRNAYRKKLMEFFGDAQRFIESGII